MEADALELGRLAVDEHLAVGALLAGQAETQGGRRSIGPTDCDGDPSGKAEGSGGVVSERPGFDFRFGQRREEDWINAEPRADIVRPGSSSQVEEKGRRCVRDIPRDHPGQPEA